MRKLSVILILILIVSFFPVSSRAVEIAAGTKLWYVDWDPFFKEPMVSSVGKLKDAKVSFDMEPTFMAGPVISLILGHIGISASFTYGNFKGKVDTEGDIGNGLELKTQNNFVASRYDVDLSLSYRIISQLKAFIGYKYQVFTLESTVIGGAYNDDDKYVNTQAQYMSIKAPLSGPGFGIGYTHNLGVFFIGGSVAGVIVSGEYNPEASSRYQVDGDVDDQMLRDGWGMNYSSTGITLEPFIGLQAGERAVMLLGFRYQTMTGTLKAKDGKELWTDENGDEVIEVSDAKDTFIGGSISISLIF